MKLRQYLFNKCKMIILLLSGVALFCIWQDNDITITKIKYQNDKVPVAFNGYRIVQLSDLHNKSFGKHQKQLINKIKEQGPDIIVITGDIIDKRRVGIEAAVELIRQAAKIAPIYYVPGNHEAISENYSELKQKFLEAGVNILENTELTIRKKDTYINIIGVKDPNFYTYDNMTYYDDAYQMNNTLISIVQDDNQSFKILLSHRPELFNIYSKNNMDLVFTGHAHGGQFRIPFIGGLVAPNQGVFPKYTSGAYQLNNTTMIVNRGLGNSIVPIRIFNRPEIISLTIQKN